MGKAACRFVIEEALASDILAIYEIGRICFSDAWRKETVNHDFQGTHSHYLVARTSEKVIGYACFWYVLDEAQLVNIGVLPEFRKQGVARAILEGKLDYTQDVVDNAYTCLGCKSCFVQCGRIDHHTGKRKDSFIFLDY